MVMLSMVVMGTSGIDGARKVKNNMVLRQPVKHLKMEYVPFTWCFNGRCCCRRRVKGLV